VAWIVRLVSLGADGEEHSTNVLRIARPGDLTAQARVHAARRPECRSCGTACLVKDYRQHVLDWFHLSMRL
jgi:hypothetical protein